MTPPDRDEHGRSGLIIQARLSHHGSARWNWSLTGDPHGVWRSIEPYIALGYRVEWEVLRHAA